MRLNSLLFLLTALWFSGASAQNGPSRWTATPFNPPALPLAVRSPYLNTWLLQGNDPPPLNDAWSRLWDAGGVRSPYFLFISRVN